MSEAYMTLAELARQLGTRADRLAEFCRREEDPLPVRFMPGRQRGGFVIVSEVDEWMERNTVPWKERYANEDK